jgi:hypothetical protein
MPPAGSCDVRRRKLWRSRNGGFQPPRWRGGFLTSSAAGSHRYKENRPDVFVRPISGSKPGATVWNQGAICERSRLAGFQR